jgi:hypothetical protein
MKHKAKVYEGIQEVNYGDECTPAAPREVLHVRRLLRPQAYAGFFRYVSYHAWCRSFRSR